MEFFYEGNYKSYKAVSITMYVVHSTSYTVRSTCESVCMFEYLYVYVYVFVYLCMC